VNLIVAVVASGAAERIARHGHARALLERITGVVFIGIGLRLATASRR
jgi:threonine/homoserine/homoserine lactone efflux protein